MKKILLLVFLLLIIARAYISWMQRTERSQKNEAIRKISDDFKRDYENMYGSQKSETSDAFIDTLTKMIQDNPNASEIDKIRAKDYKKIIKEINELHTND